MNSLSIVVLLVCSSLVAGGLVSPRIVGGKPAVEGQFPWQAELKIKQSIYRASCSGALISDQWVLTSGDCAYDAQEITVYLGSIDSLKGVSYITTEVFLHPDYVPPLNSYDKTLEYNIGLVKLPEKINITDTISPIDYQGKGGVIDDGVELVVSGWGQTGDYEDPSLWLRYVSVVSVTSDICEKTYGTLPVSVVCTNGFYERSGPCYDDGAPLVKYQNDGTPTLVGVHFLHTYYCEENDPTGYTRTAPYRQWINDMISQ